MRHFLEFTDPRTLLVGEAGLQQSKERLEQFEQDTLPPTVSDDQLWRDRILIQNTYAKDGTKIPWPFRLSGYALANLPILVGLMWPNLGVPGTIFWQWLNQTQNALLNHYNRPSIEPLPREQVVPSYFAAVASAVTLSVGSNLGLARAPIKEALRANLRRFVPFVAVATGNALNTYLMRRQEMVDGIVVRDPDSDEIVGKSKIAATRAVGYTCLSRVALSAMVLAIPPVVLPHIERFRFFATRPKLRLPLHISFVSALLFSVVPLSVAVFEENRYAKSEELEPELGKKFPGKLLVYSKGL